MASIASLTAFSMLWLPIAAQAAYSFQEKCLHFAPESYVYKSTRNILSYIPATTNLTFPNNDPTCNRTSQVVSVDLCRVALSIATSNRSGISFEIWLPENWTGRFLVTGNGGIDGCIKYEDLAYTTQHGFASTGSNNGHNGTTAIAMLNNPDIVTDFAWRSLHTSTTAGKRLVQEFYQKPHTKAYFLGCSLGGRQGIKAAEMYPADFDGIVAGSPAIDFNNLQSWRASFSPITGSVNSSGFISPSTWKHLIHGEVLNQCDGLDGVVDGVESPKDIQSIVWPAWNTYTRPCNPEVKSWLPRNYMLANHSATPRNGSDSNPAWDPATFSIQDATVANALNPSNIRTWPATLANFQDHGGKMLLYHGGQDNQISSFNTERFYNFLSRGMHELDDFFRFFRVPGMFHCNSGPSWAKAVGLQLSLRVRATCSQH